MTRTTPLPRGRHQVVVAGGGVAGLETVLALAELAPGLVDVELIAPEHHFWYRPLAVAEPFDAGRVLRFELGDLARETGAVFTPGQLVGVRAEERLAELVHGADVPYDSLVLAAGAVPEVAVPGALTFRGPADTERFRALLDEVEETGAGTIVFVDPAGTGWPLPLYELALMTAAELSARAPDVRLVLVTHESTPLELFGKTASAAVGELLRERGVELVTGLYASAWADGVLETVPNGPIEARWAVALPTLRGPELTGLPRATGGFVPTDRHGRVPGLDGVYAAGDLTTFPVKQGGLAAQQADAVAEAIAAAAGAGVEPRPFEPILRGLLLTGGAPAYLRAELGGGRGETSLAASEALWWPPGKIVGRYLAPFLARVAGVEPLAPLEVPGVLSVEVQLDGTPTTA
jgi:sulfide:quinone oxidoreductase